MAIHYRNFPVIEPFIFDSIGCCWSQDRVLRPKGFPLYHYLQTEQGCGTVKVQGTEYVLNENEGLLISPYLHHSYERNTEEWLTAFATFTGTIHSSIDKMVGNKPIIFIEKEQGAMISALINEIMENWDLLSADTRALSLKCYDLLMHFTNSRHPRPLTDEPLYLRYVAPIIKEIETHYNSELTVSDLSGRVYVTPQYLSRLFRRFLGCSVYEYLTTQLGKLPVKLRLGVTVTAETVRKEQPDAVVIATSSPYAVPDIPGIHSSRVFTIKGLAGQVKLPMRLFGPRLLEKLTHVFLPVGKRVVVLGGQIEGVQGAVFLKKRGREVTIIEESASIGGGIPERFLQRIGPWFRKKGVEVLTESRAEAITDDGVKVRLKDGTQKFVPCDSVMVLMPQVPDTALTESLQGIVAEVHVIGSSLGAENGLLKHALLDGRRVGCRL